MSAPPGLIVCPTCHQTNTAPPGSPVIRCYSCGNVFSVGPAPPPGPYGAAPYPPAAAPPYPPAAAPPYPPAHMSPYPSAGAFPPPYPPAAPGPAVPFVPSGRRKAMIVGICYRGSRNELGGCINDANCMKYMITSKMGFKEPDILFMTDDQPDPLRRPTRANLINGMRWLVMDARPGDSLFFHYSGHGGQERDRSGEERDGFNETLLPLDFQSAGAIVDDEINRIMINPLPGGVRLHAIVDACHSGTVLDLPFQWRGHDTQNPMAWEDQRSRTYKGTAGGEAISFSGCDDNQTSADTTALSKTTATGAMTFAFIQAIESGKGQTYLALMNSMRALLKGGPGGSAPFTHGAPGLGMLTSMLLGGSYQSLIGSLGRGGGGPAFSQIPQLTASAPFDLNRPFMM